MKKSTLIKIQLANPENSASSLTSRDSWLFSNVTVHRADLIIGFAADNFVKNSNYAKIFPELKSGSNDNYDLELGATLPEMLPSMEGKLDYTLRVTTKTGIGVVHISNRMRRIDFDLKGVRHFGIFPAHGEKTIREKIEDIPEAASATPVNSTATMRFKISGSSAEEALENHVEKCIKQFILCLNRILTTCYSIAQDDFGYFSLKYSQTSFPWLYVFMRGSNKKAIKFDRIASHAGRVSLITQNFTGNKANTLKKILRSTPDRLDPHSFLASAKIASLAGLEQLALLQSVIASEMATAHYIKGKLLRSGLPKKRWDNHKNDIRYSQMLDIYLPLLTPDNKKSSPEVIALLNRARTLRNSLMHEGNEAILDGEISKIIQATSQHLDFLKDIGGKQLPPKRQKSTVPTKIATVGKKQRKSSIRKHKDP